MKKRETIRRLRKIIAWYRKERMALIDEVAEQDVGLIQMQHDLSEKHDHVRAIDALVLEERQRADAAERCLSDRDQQIRELQCQLVERLQLAATCVGHMVKSRRERDAFRDQVLMLEEQLGQQDRVKEGADSGWVRCESWQCAFITDERDCRTCDSYRPRETRKEADPDRAYRAEVERDAALSDVVALSERVLVLERLLTRWVGDYRSDFHSPIVNETRRILGKGVPNDNVAPV